MKFKKLLTILLSLCLSFVLVLGACGTENGGTTDGGDGTTDDGGDTTGGGDGGSTGGDTSGGSTDEEYTLELVDGYRQLTIYYYRAAGYDNCDIWMWYDGADLGGQTFHTCEYGAKVVVNIPEDIELVGFIIRTNCSDPGGSSWGTATKDATEDDRYITMTDTYTVIYTKAGDANTYTSTDGGKTLTLILKISLADMQTLTTVSYTFSSSYKIGTLSEVTLTDNNGSTAGISKVSTVGQSAVSGVITTSENLDITKAYTLNIGGTSTTVIPRTYYSSAEFEDEYSYDGDLGVELAENSTTFRLWAPTASKVVLNLYSAGDSVSAYYSKELTKGEKGVWTHVESSNLNGIYYTYTVTTGYGTEEAVDPYAVSAGVNGQRGMILDLDSTDPDGWTDEPFDNPDVENYTDAEIWEVQVRDFSVGITSSRYPGKFLAFTESGLTQNGHSVGLDYLKELGITHVHLMPSFDFASVDETKTGTDAEYNWGYDPQNYNVPEGSYSTDPYDGSVRVNEFKQMVKALHEAGISVVMDVVYNHTYDSNSNLNKVVPYYYYRYNTSGSLSNGSGCGNETASERSMFSKYMVDSVTYWQTEYNIDGFRFDLMALHDIETMQEIEEAVHTINEEAIIYGEGWTGGTSTLGSSSQSTLSNLRKVNSDNDGNGIAMFSDTMRDAIKGSVFDITDVGFATGANTSDADDIIFSMRGSVYGGDSYTNTWYAGNPTQVINYASAHDNNTLWDRICYVYGTDESTLENRLKRNALSAAIVQTSLGVPFMMAGEELLRSKVDSEGNYVSDSYNSGDYVNRIYWDYSVNSSIYRMSQYYKGLIAFRKSSPTLRSAVYTDGENVVCTVDSQTRGALIVMEMSALDGSETLLIVYNAFGTDMQVTLPNGAWDLYISGMTAGDTAIESGLSGSQTVGAISCSVYRKAN